MKAGPRVNCHEAFASFVPSNSFYQICLKSFLLQLFFIVVDFSAPLNLTFLLWPTVKQESQKICFCLGRNTQVNNNSLHLWHSSWELHSSLLLHTLYTDLWINNPVVEIWYLCNTVYMNIYSTYIYIHLCMYIFMYLLNMYSRNRVI